MTSAEASKNTLGPRYAQDDPTLPQPWKGLIDGVTGVLYYWNPETNVTQYEKPTALPPPLPPGPPPAAPAPKLNPIPVTKTLQSDGVQNQQNSQSLLQQQIHLTPQVSQQPPSAQLLGSHLGTGIQQPGHLAPEQTRTPMMQQPSQQVPSHLGQMSSHPAQQGLSQSTPNIHLPTGSQSSYQQMPHGAQGQSYPSSHMGNPHGFQYNPHQMQYVAHQNMTPHGPQGSSQHMMHGLQLPPQQEHMAGLDHRDDTVHHGKQAGISPAHQHVMQGKQFSHSVTGEHYAKSNYQYGDPSVNMQQSNSSYQVHQTGTDIAHLQHGSRFPNQMDPGLMHNQQPNAPPVGPKMAYDENHLCRAGTEYNYSINKGTPAMHQLPKLAPLPAARYQQEMWMGDFPQNITPGLPGRLNGPVPSGGSSLRGVYNHASGTPPFPNNAFLRPPAIMGPSEPNHLSTAEIFCQKHEVTATVRYRFQRGSTCQPTIRVSNAVQQSSSTPFSRSSTLRRQGSMLMRRQRSGTSSKQPDRAEESLFSELVSATNNFALENKIGGGNFGGVYKGKLNDGREVAIKRSEMGSKVKLLEKESSFESELAFLSRLHHKHLVRLVGYCEEMDERLLVYEYMKNGALHDHLHGKNNVEKSSSLVNSWKMRIKISLDAARGIEYLHNFTVPPIIHRDIKSSNILLDANFTARVSDFGLSLKGPEGDQDYRSMKAAGTVGYIDPEYYGLNILTTKSDVYGLGVVLLELLTGKKAIFKNGINEDLPISLVDFAVPAIMAGELAKILDARVGQLEMNESEAWELMAYTAVHCVHLEGKDRLNMSDVVVNLERALALCDGSQDGRNSIVSE